MKKLLPGRRIAARQWVSHMGSVLKGFGFVQSPGHPHLFRDPHRDLTCEVHMDDIHGCGATGHVDNHLDEIRRSLPLKKAVRHTVGDTYEHLKKTHVIKSAGRWIQPSTRYVLEVARRLGLENCKPAITPESEAIKPTTEDGESPLNEEQSTEYRSLTCTLLYAAHYIVEAQHGVRNLTMDLKTPNVKSWERLKRMTRYLMGVLDEGVWFEKKGEESMKKMLITTDTDWAGCKRTRKSCGMTVIRVGGCVLYTQCTGQAIHAQSSGESEFYGNVSGVSAGRGLSNALDFIGMPVTMELESDSSAARGVLWRSGIGKIRHLEVKTLWIQDMVHAKELVVKAVKGAHNVADIGTKILAKPRIDYLKGLLNIRRLGDLPAPRVQAVRTSRTSGLATQVAQAVMCVILGSSPSGADGNIVMYINKEQVGSTDQCKISVARIELMPIFYGMLILMLGIIVGMRCRGGHKDEEKLSSATVQAQLGSATTLAQQEVKQASVDKLTQSQVTYQRKKSQPRFQPLGPHDHGCW